MRMKVKINARIYNPIYAIGEYNKAFVMFGHIKIREMHYYFAGQGYTAKVCIEDFVRNVKRVLLPGMHGKIKVSRG